MVTRSSALEKYTYEIDLLIVIVPCYGKASLDINRNRFCAYCNGLSDEEISLLNVPWTFQLKLYIDA